MPDYLAAILDILGPTGVVVPIGMPQTNWRGQVIGENTVRTTVTSAHGGSGVNAVFTYLPGARTTWAKQTYYRGRGRVPILPFNGTTEYLTSPDIDYFSSIEPAAYSVGGLLSPEDVASSGIVWAKDNQGIQREWDLGFSLTAADSTFGLLFRDQSAAVFAWKISNTVMRNNELVSVAATYGGGGGATAANGISLFTKGAARAGTATNNASYVAMENLTSVASIGAAGNGASFFKGWMAGGVCGLWMAKVQLTADQISRITAIQLEALKPFGPDLRKLARR